MVRLQDRSEQLRLLNDSSFPNHDRLLRTGVISLLFHLVLLSFLVLGLRPLHTKGESVVYRVTLRTVPPQTDSSPSAAHTPMPVKTHIKKEKTKREQEIKQKEDVFEKKDLDSEIHPSAPILTSKIPLEEQKHVSLSQKKEEAPIPLPIGELLPSDTDSNIKIKDNLPVLLSFVHPGEQNQNIISRAGTGEGSGQGGFGSGGSGDGSGTGRGGSGGAGWGDGSGQGGFGLRGSGKRAGIGQGGSSGGGSGDSLGLGRGGSGLGGSGNYGTGMPHPRYAENPKPIYPLEAREKGYKGEVLLRVEVLSNGGVGKVEVKGSSGYQILDQSALSAVKKWKFIPGQKGGVAIPVWVNIPIKFELL